METFNKLFEDLGVQSASMDNALDQVTGTTVDISEVFKFLYNLGG